MVDDGLEALRQGYEASLRQLQTLLDAQARLRETAEQLAAETRQQLERLAEALCPQLVDTLCKKDPLGLAGMAPQALAEAVARDVQRRLSCAGAAELAGQSVEELYETALEELAQLREGNARLENELAQAREQAREAELHAAVVRRSLEEARGQYASSPAGQPAAPLPDWVREWQEQETHAHDLALLRVVAETGVARRERAARLLGERLGVAPASGDVVEAFRRCRRLGLIEDVGDGDEGLPSPLLRLAPRGADACRLLLAREPAPGLATGLLARHGSTARVLLCLEAADVLREAGYQVDVLPEPLPLPDGRPFTPHLAAARDGGVLLAEVVDEPREQADRWQDCADAGDGRLYVAVPDRAALERVKSEIMFRAARRPLALWMMALDEARGKRGDEVWTFRRDVK